MGRGVLVNVAALKGAERLDKGYVLTVADVEAALARQGVGIVAGESNSPLFGGSSNWRGPIWMPVDFTLIQAIEKFHRFLGDNVTVAVPCLGGRELNLREIANLIADRLVDIYRRNGKGAPPAMQGQSPFADDPDWKDLLLFYEYFHAETGQGLGASHQTGWTGLIANLVARRYRRYISKYWRQGAASRVAAE